MQNSSPMTIKVKTDIKKRLQALSKLKRRSAHWLMKEAIDSYLTREEYAERLRQETLSRWQEATSGKVVSHQAVTEWLNSWGTPLETDKPGC